MSIVDFTPARYCYFDLLVNVSRWLNCHVVEVRIAILPIHPLPFEIGARMFGIKTEEELKAHRLESAHSLLSG